ncbi:calcium-binding protein [Maridesulfovibrio frigidus]|uniref:calcium-binding protein n=1 Tax=Maridesulfovibrio frigidus TaxID=340956 RepID=UPI0004E26606|nr:calcium-binding protein [Maridesulfovibrio frigidus]
MNKRFDTPVNNWCFDRLEQRILLSGEAMVEPVDAQESSESSEEAAGEIVTVDDQAVVELSGIGEYEPEVQGVLVDLSPENVLPEVNAALADVLPDISGLTDIHLTPDEILEAPSDLIIDADEILTGTGEINGTVVNEGTVSPGNSPGLQTVDTYTQASDGTLIMEIGGLTAGPGEAGDIDNGYDQITVNDAASFDGTLDIHLINGFTPTAGQVFDIVNYGSATGNFSTYTGLYIGDGLYFKPVYQVDKLQLVVEEVPAGLLRDVGETSELETLATFAATAAPGDQVVVTGGFDIGGQTLEGELTFKRSADDSGFDVLFSDLTISVGAGGATGSMVNGSGALYIADSGGTAGTMTGMLTVNGVADVSATGNVTYEFNTISGAVNRTIGSTTLNMQADTASKFSGAMTLSIAGLANMSGNFVIQQQGSGADSSFYVDGSSISSSIGTGADLVDGWMAMIIAEDAGDVAKYAFVGGGNFSFGAGSGSAVSATAYVKANTLGKSVNETFDISGTERTITFASADILAVSDFDMELTSGLKSQLGTMADSINALRDSLLSSVDDDGNIISVSKLAETIPGTNISIESLLDSYDMFALGDYIDHYLNQQDTRVDSIPLGDYTATYGVPTMTGLYNYLKTNWVPTLDSVDPSALNIDITASGFEVSFANTFSSTESVTIDLGEEVSTLGLVLDSDLVVDVDVSNSVDFDFAVDWDMGEADFTLNSMDYTASASVNDLVVSGNYGPLEVSLGKVGTEATAVINLAGSIITDGSDNFAHTTTTDTVTVNLPVFASLAGTEITGAGTPRIIIEGTPLTSTDAFTYTTENFDPFAGFTDVSVGDMILMFPNFLTMLDDIRNSDGLGKSIPFMESSLDQVFNFAEGFNQEIYSKIDFNRSLVVSVDGLSGSLTADSVEFTVAGQTFSDDLLQQYVTFEGLGTRQIRGIDGDTLTLSKGFSADIADVNFKVHMAQEQIQTVQEFVTAVNSSGVLGGLSIAYDLAEQKFTVPLEFSHTLADIESDIAFDFDMGDLAGLETSAKGTIGATVEGGLNLFFDLDGLTATGNDGALTDGSTTFTSAGASFTAAMVGYSLDIDGNSYTVASVTDGTTLELTEAATGDLAGSDYVLSEGFQIGIEDVTVDATMNAAASDPEITANLGFIGITAGGAGSGSAIQATSTASGSLEKSGGDTRFTTTEMRGSTFLDSLTMTLVGSGSASIKSLTIDPGVGSDLPLAPDAEIAIYVQDIVSPGTTVKVEQDVTESFDLAKLVADGGATSSDTITVIPDLGDGFAFQELSFLDIVKAVRMGIDFVGDAFGSSELYTAILPILNFSLMEAFSVVDDFAAQLEIAAENPAASIQQAEAIFEDAFGLNDNNSLDKQDQAFSLYLDGDVLNMHMDYGQVMSKLVTFNVDLKQLQDLAGGAIPGLDGIDTLSDQLGAGAAANILLEGMFELQVDAGIQFASGLEPEIFLYDYDETRIEQVTSADLSGVPFVADSSEVTAGMYANILAEFQAAIDAAEAGGETVTYLQAVVVSAIDGGSEAVSLLTDRQRALLALEAQLETDLSIDIELFVGERTTAADAVTAAATAAFVDIQISREKSVSADKARGTYGQLGFRVAGNNMDMDFEVGPMTLGVEGGTVVIDGDGDVDTHDFATLTVRLDQLAPDALGAEVPQEIKDALPENDGRFYLGTEDIKFNIIPVVAGDMDINLPLRMDFAGLEFDLPSPMHIEVLPDIDFGDFLNGLTLPDPPDLPSLSIDTPDIIGFFQGLGGNFNLLSILQNPGLFIDGIDFSLGALQDIFLNSFTVDLPIIGDVLGDFSGFLGDIRIDLLADLRADLSIEGGLIQLVRMSYFEVFGESGLDILQDSTGDAIIDINDVLVGWYDIDQVSLGDWTTGGDLPDNVDAVQFDMQLGGSIVATGVDIPLDIELPGFEFDIDGGFGLDADWSFDFGTGISGTDGFYMVADNGSDPEFEVDVNVFLDGDPSTTAVDPFVGTGQLAFFKATLTDNGIGGGKASGLYGGLDIDFKGDSRGRMTNNFISSQPASKVFVPEFFVDGELNLGVVLEVDGVAAMPKLVGDLTIDWDWTLANGATAPVINIENLGVDVDSLVDDFLLPITEQIEDILTPIKPIVDGLYTPISGLDALGVNNVMDLIDIIMILENKPAVNWAFVEAARFMLEMPDTVRSWSAAGGVIILGDILNLGSDNVTVVQRLVDLPEALESNVSALEGKAQGSGSAGDAARSGFKSLEYVTDISNWMNVLTGGDATLFTYEMPLLVAEASFRVPIAGLKLGPADFGIMAIGGLTATADLAFGYDTAGIKKSLQTGDALDAFDGFYVSDVTLPEFADGSIVPGTGGEEKPELSFDLDVGIEAGVSAGIVKAGLVGTITFFADFDLQDIARSTLTKDADGYVTDVDWEADGKIRMSEILTMVDYGGPEALFNTTAGAVASAGAYVKVKIPVVGTKTVVDIELFETTLFEISIDAPNVKPDLGHMEGSTLHLNAGTDAGLREYFDTKDSGEQFWLSGDSGTVNVEFDNWYQTFTGVTDVVVDMGEGDDFLDATLLTDVSMNVRGGAGDDTILIGSGGGSAFGDAGDDTITVVSGTATSTLEGGTGDDKLTALGGNDFLRGGAGNDRLFGGTGSDSLDGGTGDDVLEGGAGNDTYVFGDDFGSDRYSDNVGDVALDFSSMTTGLDMSIGRNGVSGINTDGGEFRLSSGKVNYVKLGSGNDVVRVKDFTEWTTDIVDTGGNDKYQVTAGRAGATLATGTINIKDNSGAFDEVIVTQTSRETPLFVNNGPVGYNGQVANGREVLNFDSGLDRLTLAGDGADFNGGEIESFGGGVVYDTAEADNVSDIGTTGFRVIGQNIDMRSEIKAGHVILDSIDFIDVTERLTATSSGYVDLRSYGDGADITLNADVLVSAGTDFAGDGSGWVRMVSADGAIINGNGSEIIAAASYLQLRAKDGIGATSAPLLTTVMELTALTSEIGSGDIVITETDDLNIIVQRTLSGDENPGLHVDPANGEDRWESKLDWDNAASVQWLSDIQAGRSDYGIEVGNGNLLLTQKSTDGLLTLESGDIHTILEGANITLTVDDVDFVSGEDMIISSGDLTIQADSLAWDYLLGTAAESIGGGETLNSTHTTSLNMGLRDFAALADGFNLVTIGRRNADNTMTIGDIYTPTEVKMTGTPRSEDAILRDHTVFLSDELVVMGNVQGTGNTVELHGYNVSINSQNFHDPLGTPDSGVTAKEVIVQADEQLHVGGWLVADDLVDIDVTATSGVNRPASGFYVAPPNGVTSVFMDVGSRIESLNADSTIDIDGTKAMQIGSFIEAHGAGSTIDIDVGTDFLLKEAATVAARSADGLIDINAGGVLAINAGSAVSAGIRYNDVDGKPVPELIGAGADIVLISANEMLLGGSVGTADGLTVSSGTGVHDNEDYGDPDHISYSPAYSIYNKQAYFDMIKGISPDHYLQDHNSGYGLMVTGTIVSLGDNQQVVLSSADDFILRGNVSAIGSDSGITLQSDTFTYVEGFVTADKELKILGGIQLDGTDVNGMDQHGSSLYVHGTSTLRTAAADGDILVDGSADVDLYGVLVAGGSVGTSGVIWSGEGADLTVRAGSQLNVDTGLLAAGNVIVKGGTPGIEDNDMGLLVTTAGGMTARGYNGVGGNIIVTGSGNMEMMGTMVAGGSLVQTFDDEGVLLSQHIDWSGTEGTTNINVAGQAFIGGNTVNKDGDATVTGGYIHSAGDLTIQGGSNDSGTGVRIQGASEIAVKKVDGLIHVIADQDAEIMGLLAAGGEIKTVRDASGAVQGRYIETFGGASRVKIEADNQIRVGVGLKAGQSIDLIGGVDPVEADPADGSTNHSGKGIVLLGSAQLETWMENSTINLNAPGRIDVLAPGHTNEILADAWPYNAAGTLPHDVTLDIVLDKVSHDITASVTISAADTADNTSLNDLMADVTAALEAATWTVTRSDVPEFVVGDTYADFADDPTTGAQVDPDMELKLRDGRLNFTGPYGITIADSSVNGDYLGLDLASGDLESGLYYAIDARNTGSVVNLGAEDGPNDKIYVGGKVIANKAINMYSGTSADGVDIDLDATGVLETVNGSIEFNAGENGVIKGNVIAGGVGSDIILNSDTRLEIRGTLEAYDSVVLTGGTTESTGQESLKIEGTAKILSTGGGGTLTLNGANDVVIDGVVGSGSNALAAVNIDSEFGDVTLAKTSGRITANTPLTITGKNIDIQGVIESVSSNGAGAEVSITADNNLTIQGDVSVDYDLALHAGNSVEIFDAAIEVNNAESTIRVTSDGNITSSKVAVASGHDTLPDGQLYQQGATIQGTGSIFFDAADSLTIGSAILVGTSDAGSKITLEGSTVTVMGSVLAGATVTGGTTWTGADSVLDVDAIERLNIGGDAIDSDGFNAAAAGNLKSSGNLTIDVVGGSNDISVNQNSLSSISANSAVGDLEADATASHVTINTDHGISLYGFTEAPDAEGTVTINAGDTAFFDGITEAGKTITVIGGDDDSGKSILSRDHVYKRDIITGFFLDAEDKLMDGLGNLVDADGDNVDASGVKLADGVEPVKGGDPIRLSGATFDVGEGGTITFEGVADVYLGGQVGRPKSVDGAVTTNPVTVTATSTIGTVAVTGLVNAVEKVTVQGNSASVFSGGVIRTYADSGQVEINVTGNVLVSGDDGLNGKGIISAADRVHIKGDNVRLDGNISASRDSDSWIVINGITSAIMGGVLSSQGDIDVRGGITADWTQEQLLASSVDVAILGDALVQVVGQGSLNAQGDINIITGGDFEVDATAALGDGQKALLTPIITNRAVTVQIPNGYQKVADGFILMPEVSWVATTLTDQVGTEEVKSGIEYFTMDVTLTQDAYYNGTTLREWFVEGVDYHNASVNWSVTGAISPVADYSPFNTLTDAQQDAVLKHLGYMRLYDFSYSNPERHVVENGNPTKNIWTPAWKDNDLEIVHIVVSGWEDKYIRMQQGAAADVLRVVTQGEAVVSEVVVGRYQDQATVKYTQVSSAHRSSSYDVDEPWGALYESYDVTDYDGVDASWDVSYVASTGDRFYEVYDGRTGASQVNHYFDPLWVADSTDATRLSSETSNKSDLKATATVSYFDTTLSVGGKIVTNTHNVDVGIDEAGDDSYGVDIDPKGLAITHVNGAGFVERKYTSGTSSSTAGHVKINSTAEFEYLQVWTDGKFSGTEFLDIGLDVVDWNAVWYDDTDVNGSYGIIWATGGENDAYWTSYSGDDFRVVTNYSGNSTGWVKEAAPEAFSKTLTEDFKDYNYDWESTWNNVSDDRRTLQYQYVSDTTDRYSNRPIYRTYDDVTKVVQEKSVTIWRNNPIFEDVVVNRTERVLDDGGMVNWGEFEQDALNAVGNINVVTADDISVSGLVTGSGVDSTVTFTAGGDITVNGKAPVGGGIAAESLITSSGEVKFVAENNITIGDAGSVITTLDETGVVVEAGGDAIMDGDITTKDSIVVQAANDIKLGGHLKAANFIDIDAGFEDGSGAFTGDAGGLLEVTAAEGFVNLTAGTDSGDMNITDTTITALDHVTLTAEGGAIRQTGGVITTAELTGLSQDGFEANTSIDSLAVTNTVGGGLVINNDKALIITDFDTASGSIDVTTFGALNAGRLTTGGMTDDDDIRIKVYNAGVTYNTIAVGEGGEGDVTIEVQDSINVTGDESRMIGDVVTIEVPGAINITTIANTLNLSSYEGGDITINDISADGVNLGRVIAGEGEISVTALGDVGIKDVQVLSERRDLEIISGGLVFGIDNGVNPNIFTDQLTISAETGIENISTRINELKSISSTAGDISFINTEYIGDIVADLTITDVRTGDGDVSITSDGVILGYTARAEGADSKLTLRSTADSVVIRDTFGAGGVWGGSGVELDAAKKLDLEVNVDAEDDLILRSGTEFILPTTSTYAADNITLESRETIKLENDLVFGGGTLELISSRDVLVSGNITSSDGSNVDNLKITAQADNSQKIFIRDTTFGYVVYHDAGGNEVLETPEGKLVRAVVGGRYAQTAMYSPDTPGAAVELRTVMTSNLDGTGSYYTTGGASISEAEEARYSVLERSFIDVTSTTNKDDLTVQVHITPSSDIRVSIGSSKVDNFNFEARGNTGEIDLDTNSDLNLTTSTFKATGDIDINTTGTLATGTNTIDGVSGNYAEYINLTSGGNMVVDGMIEVADGVRTIKQVENTPIEGRVTLTSGGTIISNVDTAIAGGSNLTTVSVGETKLVTDVDNLNSTITGVGNLTIKDSGTLTVENAQIREGNLTVESGSTLNVESMALTTDKMGNAITLINTSGNVYVDSINAGRSFGMVMVVSNGDLRELSPVDADIDLTANMLAALTTSETTDLELNVGAEVIGRSKDFDLEISGDFTLFGTFGGLINLDVHGTLYVGDVNTIKNITLAADNAVEVQGDVVTTGVVGVTGPGINVAADGSIQGGSVNLDAGTGTINMAAGSSIEATSGNLVAVTETSMLLTNMSSAGNMNLTSSSGAILDGNGDDAANLVVGGNAILNAANGIGVEGGDALETAITGTLTGTATAGGINLADMADLTIGAGNLISTSGAVALKAAGTITLTGDVVAADSTATLLAGGNIAQGASSNVQADSGVSVSSSTGGVTQADGATIISTTGTAQLDAQTDVRVSSVTAEGNALVTSRTGTIFDNTAGAGANVTSINGVINLSAGVDIGEVANAFDVDGAVTAAAGGNINIAGVGGLGLAAGGIQSSGGSVTLSTVGNAVIDQAVTAAGAVAISGDDVTTSSEVTGQSVSITAGGINYLTGDGLLTATDGDIDLTGASIVQTGNMLADAANAITVTSTAGDIAMRIQPDSVTDQGIGGALITGDGTITYVSAKEMSVGSLITEGEVRLTAQDGSISNGFDELPTDFSPEHFIGAGLNIVAETMYADATAMIGKTAGSALNIEVDNLSALSGEGVNIWARGGATIIDPGVIVDGDGDIVMVTNADSFSFDPDAVTDPLHGITGEGVVRFRTGFVVPPPLVVVPDTSVDVGTGTGTGIGIDSVQLANIADRIAADDLGNDPFGPDNGPDGLDPLGDFNAPGSVLGDIFGNGSPQLILQELFNVPSQNQSGESNQPGTTPSTSNPVATGGSIVGDVAAYGLGTGGSLVGDASFEGVGDGTGNARSLFGGIGRGAATGGLGQIGSLFDGMGGDGGADLLNPETAIQSLRPVDRQTGEPRSGLGIGGLPALEGRNAGGLLQFPDDSPGIVLPGEAAPAFTPEGEILLQGQQPVGGTPDGVVSQVDPVIQTPSGNGQ